MIDIAIARIYMALACRFAMRAANIASACHGPDADEIERVGDAVADLLKPWEDEDA